MIIRLINVAVPQAVKDEISSLLAGESINVQFEDTVGLRSSAIVNESLVGEALGNVKVHCEASRLNKGYFVRDIASGVVNSEHNIVNNNGMRLARDVIQYTEQDIERVVRSALEISGAHKLLLVTKSNTLITSRVWQRITAEVAADYSAEVDFAEVDDFILYYNIFLDKYPLVIADSFIGDILKSLLSRLGEIHSSFFAGESESYYITDGSMPGVLISIYEYIKEKDNNAAKIIEKYVNSHIKN